MRMPICVFLYCLLVLLVITDARGWDYAFPESLVYKVVWPPGRGSPQVHQVQPNEQQERAVNRNRRTGTGTEVTTGVAGRIMEVGFYSLNMILSVLSNHF